MKDELKTHSEVTPGKTEKFWHALTVPEVAGRMSVDLTTGLTEQEAKRRLAQFGPNRLEEEEREPLWEEFLEELREPLVLLLLFTGLLYVIWGEIGDAITIFLVILTLNTIEVLNERRAKNAVKALRKLAEPTAFILRDGGSQEITVDAIVPGDVMLLRAGRRVPADARLIEAYGLAMDESSLTGESVPVDKDPVQSLPELTPLAERHNVVFSGTLVTRGRGSAIVVATGMSSELGQIAGLTRQIKEPRTPLQEMMDELSKWLLWLALGFSVLVPVLGVVLGHQSLKMMLLTGLSLAFATIPEELPIIITMVLALGAYRLSKRHAIVKHLEAVETLGTVSVIATDKTGTLTENRMTLKCIYPQANRQRILEIAALCNDVSFDGDEFTGDPLETSLLRAAKEDVGDIKLLQESFPLINEFTFDNRRKRMSVVRKHNNRYWVSAKGSPETILSTTAYQLVDGNCVAMGDDEREILLSKVEEMAAQGLRTIAFAEKFVPAMKITQEFVESELTFVGLAGLQDPPRDEVREAIASAKQAGVRTVMITGDHPLTAQAIADQVGLNSSHEMMTGIDLDDLDDQRLEEKVKEVSIYARTNPEHKLRVVRAFMEGGERVAVTGDGVNDAPALAMADIGVAMGESGSDVAREAADIVLADDHFTTIMNAISEGRVLFENLRKGVRYYLAIKVALVSTTLLPVLLGVPVPFAPIQIILMELFMDLAAAATFVAEPAESDLMLRPPRDPNEPFMSRGMVASISGGAMGLFAAVSFAYLFTWFGGAGLAVSQAVAFITWMLGHVLLALNMRSERQPLYQIGFFSNRLMVLWGAATILFVILATRVPALHGILRTVNLTAAQWALVCVSVAAGTFWLEVYKLAAYRGKK